MHESASRPLGTLVTFDADLEREFEDRLRESSTLAVRVAYSVVRHRQVDEAIARGGYAPLRSATAVAFGLVGIALAILVIIVVIIES